MSRRNKLGSVVEFKLDTKSFRRLSAQAAKQVIIQAIREAERSNMVRAYEEKKDEIITALVDKVDPDYGTLVLETGEGRATLLRSEQLPGDHFEVGDHVKVLVTEVRAGESRGPVVLLSRVHPGFVKRLFELEIPEIAEGVVIIKGVSRDAGSRSKIAVYSRDENVDAIGACIGARGMRINSIVEQLGGEKIDLIEYHEDPEQFVAAALAPAEVLATELEGERTCKVRVAPDQLSLAIGKEGQNAKLAAKLTGLKIDIKARSLCRRIRETRGCNSGGCPSVGASAAASISRKAVSSASFGRRMGR
jgi:N utilization substance protein A